MQLIARKISLRREKQLVLDKVSFSLNNGLYCLAGPNGSGKTSLLAIIAGTIQASTGEILLNHVSQKDLGEDYRAQLGFLPQEYGIIPTMTPIDFLHYLAGLKGLPAYYANRRAEVLLKTVELFDKKNKKVAKLSVGEKQRLGIAQALLNDPKLLILDEPFNHLDPRQRMNLRILLKQLSQDRIILYSTHLVTEVSEADEVLLLRHGDLLLQSAQNDLIKAFEGTVWEIEKISELDFSNIKLLGQTGNQLDIKYHVYAEKKPLAEATLVRPTIEDIYFYYMNESIS